MRFNGIIQEAFEKFTFLLPNAATTKEFTELSADKAVTSNLPERPIRIKLKLLSVTVAPEFEVLDVEPSTTKRGRQLGIEFLYFGGGDLSELRVRFLSRTLDLWKTIYNIFALAISTSIIATVISTVSQSSSRSER
jgi:hypothetical protein